MYLFSKYRSKISCFLNVKFLPLFPRQSMHFARGNCGHLKAKWDTHLSWLTCNSCTRISPCYICSSWTEKVWNLAERRRLHATRKSVMTQKRNRRNQRNPRSPSQTCLTTGQLMGAPPLIALLLGAGPIKVAAWRT